MLNRYAMGFDMDAILVLVGVVAVIAAVTRLYFIDRSLKLVRLGDEVRYPQLGATATGTMSREVPSAFAGNAGNFLYSLS